jgi:hypothetical protein
MFKMSNQIQLYNQFSCVVNYLAFRDLGVLSSVSHDMQTIGSKVIQESCLVYFNTNPTELTSKLYFYFKKEQSDRPQFVEKTMVTIQQNFGALDQNFKSIRLCQFREFAARRDTEFRYFMDHRKHELGYFLTDKVDARIVPIFVSCLQPEQLGYAIADVINITYPDIKKRLIDMIDSDQFERIPPEYLAKILQRICHPEILNAIVKKIGWIRPLKLEPRKMVPELVKQAGKPLLQAAAVALVAILIHQPVS